MLLFWVSLVMPMAGALEFQYHNTTQVEQYLQEINKNYPSITHLHSIGQSVEAVAVNVSGLPKDSCNPIFRTDPVVGRVLLLQLIDYMTRNYMSDPFITQLMKTTRIHIMPSMNPDGFESSGRDCMYSQGRFNKNGVDLNRNFPDVFVNNDVEVREIEVKAVMKWLETEPFVLSANLHGGALVASYAYDNSNGGSELQGGSSITPDDDVFVQLAKTYSFNHASMQHENKCSDSREFTDGIINGYGWYKLEGGMQDYNYVWAQCLEITLEVSCCKFPPESELPDLWDANKPALLAYMQQVHLGVKGQVFDLNGAPVQNALVEVEGRKNFCPFKTNSNGEYYRLLLPGTYTITVRHPEYEPLTETVSVPYGPDTFSALTHNFRFLNSASTTATNTTCLLPDVNYSDVLLPDTLTALSTFILYTLLL
ncbi:Carboxypeptidase M [Bagarius yarrelli]|uniref:Carboxypeptidase M n=1 Tax=Bagarius yarrelli TaxID=175774 RepID=A0A556TH26_BAGYA|nr:Carboxypeptidase M [Bagarius yarrelli]